VADHKSHLLGCHVFGGDDEITFVFSARIIHYYYEFAITYAENAGQS
jgi:hypothetical protein